MWTLTAVVHKEENMYVAQCPEVGTVSQGETLEEAVDNLKEATELYLEEFPSDDMRRSFITDGWQANDGWRRLTPEEGGPVVGGSRTTDFSARHRSRDPPACGPLHHGDLVIEAAGSVPYFIGRPTDRP